MKALTLNGYEGLKSLSFAEVAVPEPRPGDVLVKIKSASVNPVDTKIAHGYGGPSQQRKLPHVLGRDGAGTVVKVGKGRGRPKGSKNAKTAAKSAPRKRKISPEGRKRIAEAMKKRWAERRKQAAASK